MNPEPRILTIRGVKYEYTIAGCSDIRIKNLSTGKRIQLRSNYRYIVSPQDIRRIIKTEKWQEA